MAIVRADIVQVHPFRVREGRIEHLVLRRSEDDELCPGAWQVITGGTIEKEVAADTAVRELGEETGLQAANWYVTGQVVTYYFAPFDAVMMSPVVACRIDARAEPVISAEHTEFRWLPADEAVALLEFASHRDGVELVERLIENH